MNIGDSIATVGRSHDRACRVPFMVPRRFSAALDVPVWAATTPTVVLGSTSRHLNLGREVRTMGARRRAVARHEQ